ncbi:MAG: DDE-type integrase/transposase/recombinase, partial [Propionibacteriaceae bacterium]|nr:DDE-type integrase/transposase/recombinase [Propionibacteriaceae bacterium]
MDGSQKWKILRLHVEDGIPLASLARETGVGERTLSRWHSLYQTGGISALERAQRADAGVRRTAPELVAFVEHLALTKPRPSIATLHRLAATEAARRGVSTPSYATVRSIVRALDPGMVTLALEGPASYRDRHELVFRHRAEEPNALWQVDHTELDILIKDPSGRPSRPWLTTVMDDYSRAICGYMVFEGAPSAMNTALALRQAIWPKSDPAWPMCGIPDVLYVDHGS